jgi:hypothetical protein
MPPFTVAGAPRSVAEAIEQYARSLGNVTALVVPWEGSGDTLSMAVTLVKSDGWAIEHTNLGTITLTPDAGGTRVAPTLRPPAAGDSAELAVLFDRFAANLPERLAERVERK